MGKSLAGGGRRRAGLRAWVVRVGSSIVIWTVVMQLMPILGPASWQPRLPKTWPSVACLDRRDPLRPNSTTMDAAAATLGEDGGAHLSPPALLPRRLYRSNGYLCVTCNGGLNQMRAAICDMVTVARYLNLTLVVPELDKTSFWADPSDFGDIFDVDHFINSLRDEVKIVRTLPQKIKRRGYREPLSMQPISWSSEKYYLRQACAATITRILGYIASRGGCKFNILPLIRKHKVVHFNRTDARLANNGIPVRLQKLRCRVNYKALRFTPQIEELGNKLVGLLLQRSASFVVLHLRYEMDMLAFSGCSHGCSERETDELTRMRYAYPWWKEKEIDSEKKRLDGLCPLTPEETALVLKALGFTSDTLIYIASGEIYGGETRMASLRAEFPKIVRKEMLLSEEELRPFRNHSTQMAALDYLVSVVSDVFIPTYDGNMAKVVEGHRRYTGFRKTILLDRRKIVELLDLLQDNELTWDEFTESMRELHNDRMGQPTRRNVLLGRPKEEDYFYSNPQECLAVPHRRNFNENKNNMRDTYI